LTALVKMDKTSARRYYSPIMASDRIQRQLDRLLDEAEEAMANDDWATVSSRAKAVLAIDPDNRDGQVYLAASERSLGTSAAAAEIYSSASDAAPPATGPFTSTERTSRRSGPLA
jgi:thioredoxin-like negative regulator of GroEL